MSIRILILKDGVITFGRSPTDNAAIVNTLGLTKASVNLNQVDNTSDLNKPISTATQTALNLKANLASPTLTGTPTTPTAVAGTNTTQIANTAFVSTAVANLVSSSPATLDTLNELAIALGNDPNFATTITNSLALKAPLASPTFTGTVGGITAAMVGLNLVNNTSDLAKPISTATQNALSLKADLVNGIVPLSQLPASSNTSLTLGDTSTTAYRGDFGTIAYNHSQTTGNPHATTKANIGLGSLVDSLQLTVANNLSDLLSRQTALNNLVGAVTTGTYLRGNGTNILLSSIQASDVPTLNQNTTGTASNITGIVALANGGTGASTQQTAINALVGNQTANRVLKSNGVNMLLSQVGLTTDVVDVLPISNGGTGSPTQNFVDLTTVQTIANNKTFSGIITFNNVTNATSTTSAAVSYLGGVGIAGNAFIGGVLNIAGQIQFPSTATPSTNVRVLDDYIEGTFLPTIIGLTTAGTATYTLQRGAFSKIGRRVFFELYLAWTAHSGSGFCRITGLPYTSASDSSSAFSPVNLWHRNFTLAANNILIGYVLEGGVAVILTQVPAGGGTQTSVNLTTSGDIMISGHYFATT